MDQLRRVDYQDSFSVPCPAGVSCTDVLLAFSTSTPPIVKFLMHIRNAVVSLFGLKTSGRRLQLDASQIRTGGQIGVFRMGEINAQSAFLGADDAHLDFRVLIEIKDGLLTCLTQVQFNNLLGRVYFFFVKPFHKLIVPAMLRASVKSLTHS